MLERADAIPAPVSLISTFLLLHELLKLVAELRGNRHACLGCVLDNAKALISEKKVRDRDADDLLMHRCIEHVSERHEQQDHDFF